MLTVFLVILIITGFIYFYVSHNYSSYPNVTKRQEEWVIRRDSGTCCFIHPENKGKFFICRNEGKYVYRVVPLKFLERVLLGNIIIPHQLVTLCEHHYWLMLRNYNYQYESDLSMIGFAHTERYQSDNPDDEFPY